MWITMLTALAAPASQGVEVGVHLGLQTHRELTRTHLAPEVSVGWRANTWFSLALGGAYYPTLRRHNGFRPSTKPPSSTPLLVRTRVKLSSQLLAVFSPIQGRFVGKLHAPFAIDLGAGFGIVQTLDDLDALGLDASKTASQIHPTLAWVIGPRLGLGKGYSAHLQARGNHWIEVYEDYPEREDRVRVALGFSKLF